MKFGSVCSGIEAASVAFGPLGWKAAWFSEIEPFPCAVLAHHYPGVPNLGDMTLLVEKVRAGEIEAPDVFTGGTPCQAFSVAGKRGSLADARGNLTLTFVEIANAIDDVRAAAGREPSVIVWENVPGVLSTSDNAFGCFLGALAGAGCELQPAGGRWTNAGVVLGPRRAVAWRVLDAQYFGLAQRRKRVFVVASARDGFDPAAVLFEFDGLRRDSAPSREAGEGAAASTARSVALRGREGGGTAELGEDCGLTLRASSGGGDKPHVLAFSCKDSGQDVGEISPTLRAMGGSLPNGGGQVAVAFAIQAGALRTNPNSGPDGVGVQADHAYTLEARAEVQAVAIRTAQTGSNGWGINTDGVAYTLDSVTQAVGFAQNQRDEVRLMEVAGALAAEPGAKQQTYMQQGMAVRRLTPVECERLMGFPDSYTSIPWRNKPAEDCPDGPRYKSLGNSWAVPCVAWIGRRIAAALQLRAAA